MEYVLPGEGKYAAGNFACDILLPQMRHPIINHIV
jgi:hypothetical protein